MAVKITLTLPENLVKSAQRLGNITQQDVTTVLADVLEMFCPIIENFSDTDSKYPPISTLSDAEIVSLAEEKMDTVQNQRLGELQAKGKETGLTAAERYELLALMQIYQIGQLRKSQALVEAVNRGLRNS
ncbi:MAG: hypothetical protein AB4372_21080 [Xenococcus sp. (in: cyanobacteria)]